MSRSIPKTLLGQRIRKKYAPVIVPIGFGLQDEREELFCLLIADGMAVAIAYRAAGFKGKTKEGALSLYRAQRIQDRVTAILRARASSPAVSLSEVTDMLKRVYVGAIHSSEYTPAHNAAFSLARLYGLVVDRAQLDVVRRPSREPDAPAELALSSWIEALPPYTPGPAGPSQGPPHGAPASPTNQGPGLLIEASRLGSDLDAKPLNSFINPGPGPSGPEARMETENGAPVGPVTGTPSPGGHSVQRGPKNEKGTRIPRAEDLF